MSLLMCTNRLFKAQLLLPHCSSVFSARQLYHQLLLLSTAVCFLQITSIAVRWQETPGTFSEFLLVHLELPGLSEH